MYRERVAALHTALADPRTKDEAFGIIRTLIDEVRLIPEDGQLRVELRAPWPGSWRWPITTKTTCAVARMVPCLFLLSK